MKRISAKVMWVGRATVFLVGLSVILAMVVGAASMAFAANGKPFLLGKGNVATKVTTLIKKGVGPALSLKVGSGPPLRVNSSAPVANLNADEVDGQDAASFAASGHDHDDSYFTEDESDARFVNEADHTKAAHDALDIDADTVDGKDSGAFAVRTVHASARASNCDTSTTAFNTCAPIEVSVPEGRRYVVSVWSTFSAQGGASNQDVIACSAGMGAGISTTNPCITPFGVQPKVTVEAGQFTAASSSGESLSLNPGTYTFFTAVKPTAEFAVPSDHDHVITKVMIRDATNNL
ncbi:MAG: hypothetical protein ACRDSJ_14950 [Rubrobacteraceae bacterium]